MSGLEGMIRPFFAPAFRGGGLCSGPSFGVRLDQDFALPQPDGRSPRGWPLARPVRRGDPRALRGDQDFLFWSVARGHTYAPAALRRRRSRLCAPRGGFGRAERPPWGFALHAVSTHSPIPTLGRGLFASGRLRRLRKARISPALRAFLAHQIRACLRRPNPPRAGRATE